MKKIFWLLVLLGAVLWTGQAAWADGEFYVITGGGAAVGTKISSLPYIIPAPGFYYLTGNLTLSAPGAGITVNADNVTIDLMGFTMNFSGTSLPEGVYMKGRHNVEIRNGTVTGFAYGIMEDSDDGANHRVINVRADNNKSSGIQLRGQGHLVMGCTASNNSGDVGNGIYLVSGTIINCVTCNNAFNGIWLWGPGSVTGTIANNNTFRNFELGAGAATSILVDRNSAFGLNKNYDIYPGSSGILMGTNAGTP